MSIFKVKQFWSNSGLTDGDTSEGTQNASCLKIDKFNSHADSDCIVVGEGSLLKIFKPTVDKEVTQTILEAQLSDPVLCIETGKFVGGIEDRQIIILHTESYAIYQLDKEDGHTLPGEQNLLLPLVKHSFTRRGYSLRCGPFGSLKTRDLICIQSLDGSLSFFDQDIFLFLCIFEDIIIPGPVSYVASCDSFVICKSTWVLEIYSYQQLREFSEMNIRQNKKNIPQWIYNAGEEISMVQVVQTSTNFSTIVALGERHFYCFQDNGLMKYMVRFEFIPMCFHAYLIGWYYEPGARLLIMVASDDAKLYIYEGTNLLWCCDLLETAICVSRCFLKLLPGGLVTLTLKGVLSVTYLGTEPDLNANAVPLINDVMDPKNVQEELDSAEEMLEEIMSNKKDPDSQRSLIENLIEIKVDVGKTSWKQKEFTKDINDVLPEPRCPVIVILSCSNPKKVHCVQITFDTDPPFQCSDKTVYLENVNGTEIVEVQVLLQNEGNVKDNKVNILFTLTDSSGKITVLHKTVLLPINLYCMTTKVDTENELSLKIRTNQCCLNLHDLFTVLGFSNEEISKHDYSGAVTLTYQYSKKTVTIKAIDECYSVEAKDFLEISPLIHYLLSKLSDHYAQTAENNYCVTLQFNEDFLKLLVNKFLKCIEIHAKERLHLKNFEVELSVLHRQFTLVQKRLLVQYGALPPGDCESLEFLMKDTHQRIMSTTHQILHSETSVSRAGNDLVNIGHLIILIYQHSTPDSFKLKLIEEMLCLDILYEDYQDWEESVSQALPYIINNIIQMSEKDKEKLATVTEQGILSQVNLKRFLKQIRLILDTLNSEIHYDATIDQKNRDTKIDRIEELVEVL